MDSKRIADVAKYVKLVSHNIRKGGKGPRLWVCPACDEPYAPVDWPKAGHIRAWELHSAACPNKSFESGW